MRVAAALLVLVTACGRIGFDATVDPTFDAASIEDAPLDTGTPFVGPGCTWADFSALPPDATSYGSATIIADGELRLAIGGADVDEGGLRLARGSLAGRSMAIQISKPMSDLKGWTGIGWHVIGSTDSLAHLAVHQGSVALVDNVGGMSTVVPYLPVEHRWLRLREQSGSAIGETSRDGVTWTILGSTGPLDTSSSYIDIGVDTPAGALAGPDFAIFDDLVECGP